MRYFSSLNVEFAYCRVEDFWGKINDTQSSVSQRICRYLPWNGTFQPSEEPLPKPAQLSSALELGTRIVNDRNTKTYETRRHINHRS